MSFVKEFTFNLRETTNSGSADDIERALEVIRGHMRNGDYFSYNLTEEISDFIERNDAEFFPEYRHYREIMERKLVEYKGLVEGEFLDRCVGFNADHEEKNAFYILKDSRGMLLYYFQGGYYDIKTEEELFFDRSNIPDLVGVADDRTMERVRKGDLPEVEKYLFDKEDLPYVFTDDIYNLIDNFHLSCLYSGNDYNVPVVLPDCRTLLVTEYYRVDRDLLGDMVWEKFTFNNYLIRLTKTLECCITPVSKPRQKSARNA